MVSRFDEGASSLARRTIVLRGQAGKMEAAFASPSTTMKQQERNSIATSGPSPCPRSTPNQLRRCWAWIIIPSRSQHFRLRDNKKQPKPKPAQTASFNPPAVGQLYSFPTGVNGAGQTISILELGGGYNSSDLSSYFAGLGIAEPRVTAVSVDGATNTPNLPSTPTDPKRGR